MGMEDGRPRARHAPAPAHRLSLEGAAMSALGAIFEYIIEKLGLLAILAVTLLSITVFSLAWGFSEAIEDLPMAVLLLPTFGGMLAGWLFGRGKLSGVRSSFWISLTG